MSEWKGLAAVDSIRSLELELEAVKVGLKAQKAIIDRHAGAKDGSAAQLKALQAVATAQRLEGSREELEEALRDSKKSLQKILDFWYPAGTWQSKAASLAAFSDLDYRAIAAKIGERPSRVRSLVADVRRRLMA